MKTAVKTFLPVTALIAVLLTAVAAVAFAADTGIPGISPAPPISSTPPQSSAPQSQPQILYNSIRSAPSNRADNGAKSFWQRWFRRDSDRDNGGDDINTDNDGNSDNN